MTSEGRRARRKTPEAREKARIYAQQYRATHPSVRARQREYTARYRERHPEERRRATFQRHAIMHDGLGGKVYFIQAESGPVKIGYTTKRPEGRMEELQVGNHESLKLLGWIPGTKADERALSERFFTDKIRGEWFTPTDRILEYLRESKIR